jgi:SH3 domain protein
MWRNQIGLAVVMGLAAIIAHAETIRYVTDSFTVTMRKGQGNQYQILSMLPSGTKVEVLQTSANGDYTKVRVEGGKQGWVLSRYLMETPGARERLEEGERQLAQIKEENNLLRAQRETMREEKSQLAAQLATLEKEFQRVQHEFTDLTQVAAEPKKLATENRLLKERLNGLESEVKLLRENNETLRRGDERAWFLGGAGVLLGGIVLGLVIPRLRWRKKSSWGGF